MKYRLPANRKPACVPSVLYPTTHVSGKPNLVKHTPVTHNRRCASWRTSWTAVAGCSASSTNLVVGGGSCTVVPRAEEAGFVQLRALLTFLRGRP